MAAQYLWDNYRAQLWGPYGFRDAFNLGFNWFASDVIGIDQGPIILMIENYRTGRVWNRFMQNADIQRGLQRAGFVAAPASDAGGPGEALCVLGRTSPNPVRGTGSIAFRLPGAGRVALALYDVQGRMVRQILDATRSAGEHVVAFDATGVPSGVYFYRLNFANEQRIERCVILQ